MSKKTHNKQQVVGVIVMLVLALMLAASFRVYADEIYLKNGDKITGDVISEKKTEIVLKTQAMGEVVLSRDAVKNIVCDDVVYLKKGTKITGEIISQNEESLSVKTDTGDVIAIDKSKVRRVTDKITDREEEKRKESPKIEWKRQLSAGYNASQGNTKATQIFSEVFLNRNKRSVDEVTAKGKVYYSEADKVMDAQQWYGMGRYAFSFGKNKKWYNFYRVEADHDRFANIDYRIIPVAGVGKWIIETEDIKLLAELGIGLEHTKFRGDTKEKDEPVLAPRLFYEQTIFENVIFTEDFYAYPSLGEFGEYRLRSETSVAMKVNDKLSIKVAVEDEYNSNPPLDIKNNDLRVTSSLVADF